MLTCLVLDDEQYAVDLLKDYIQETPFLELVAATTQVMEAMNLLRQRPVDILFLDLHMPTLTGFQFLEVARPQTHVILTTAYTQHAVQSYDYNVSDYLVKPISYDRFLKAVTKILNQVSESLPVSTAPGAPVEDFIFVKTEHKGKIQKISLQDIRYIEGLKNYVSIYTKQSDRPIVTYVGIGDMEARLPGHLFARVHRSYIVSISEVEAVDGNEIILRKPPRIPTGGKYKDQLMKLFESKVVVGNVRKSTASEE